MKINLDDLITEITARGQEAAVLWTAEGAAHLIAVETCDACKYECVGANPVRLSEDSLNYCRALMLRELTKRMTELCPSEQDEYDYVCLDCYENKCRTLGPWNLDPETDSVYGATKSGVAAIVALNVENKHDRALIAAAPELLAALKELVARCDGEEGVGADGSNIQTIAAHAAIKKAEGE